MNESGDGGSYGWSSSGATADKSSSTACDGRWTYTALVTYSFPDLSDGYVGHGSLHDVTSSMEFRDTIHMRGGDCIGHQLRNGHSALEPPSHLPHDARPPQHACNGRLPPQSLETLVALLVDIDHRVGRRR